tara:strand:- start:787 stop:978 length:192 start_codon:yes stop_codon:yes gene_type:complete
MTSTRTSRLVEITKFSTYFQPLTANSMGGERIEKEAHTFYIFFEKFCVNLLVIIIGKKIKVKK